MIPNQKIFKLRFFKLPLMVLALAAPLMAFSQVRSGDLSKREETERGKRDQAFCEKQTQVINGLYKILAKPLFQAKCFDCHSDQTKYPWYYKVWGVGQMIDHNIKEAREHLDMSKDMPFSANLWDDLHEIEEVVEDESMPPWLYRLGHPGTALSRKQKENVLKWVHKSKKSWPSFCR